MNMNCHTTTSCSSHVLQSVFLRVSVGRHICFEIRPDTQRAGNHKVIADQEPIFETQGIQAESGRITSCKPRQVAQIVGSYDGLDRLAWK
jgi:hypothetical protein